MTKLQSKINHPVSISSREIDPMEQRIRDIYLSNYSKSALLKRLKKGFEPALAEGNQAKKHKEQFEDDGFKLIAASSLEHHYMLNLTVPQKYAPLVIQMANEIEEEYDCTTASEKSLAEIIANSYVRILVCSEKIEHAGRIEEITDEKTHYYMMYGKELDRANRQYLSALTTLHQLKNPVSPITIKARAAFVANMQADPISKERINASE